MKPIVGRLQIRIKFVMFEARFTPEPCYTAAVRDTAYSEMLSATPSCICNSWRFLLEWDLINKLLWQSGALNPNHWYCSTPTTTIKSTVLGQVVLSANPWPDPTQLYSTLWYLSQQFTLQVSRFPSWSRHINKWNLTGGPTFFVSMLSRMYHDLAIDTVWN